MGSPIVGAGRLALYLALTLALIPLQALAVALRSPWRTRIPPFYHRLCTRIIGFDIRTVGASAVDGPLLVVSNHCSYLDILVLGSLIPGSFVAKSEVAGWPLFGLLAKLQETVFVERKARSAVGRQRDDMRARLEAGDTLILFPEGTSSDGNRTLPFKTALFAVASTRVDGKPVRVQPVSITPTHLDGIPMGFAFRPLYAWYGDMDLAPHLLRAFRDGRFTVQVEFHPPVSLDDFPNRKALADHCARKVAEGVSRAVAGNRAPPPALAPAPPDASAEPAAA